MTGDSIMKRLIAFAVVIMTAFCLIACTGSVTGSKTTVPNGLSGSFQADVTVILGELEAEGIIKRFGSGSWDIEFSSPNTLSGVKLSFEEGNVTASYKGLDFSVPRSALPVKSMLLNLISAVDDLAVNDELKGIDEDGVTSISGSLDGGEYTLTVDKNGNITSFVMPNNDLEIIFRNITAIGGETTTEETTEEKTTQSATEKTE
jgi:hypothetical protein